MIEQTIAKKPRGFALMDPDKRKEFARKGGASVPKDKRSFSQNRSLASRAGQVGGTCVPIEKRSFSTNRKLAAEAGRKGGQASQKKKEDSFSGTT